MKTVKKNIFSVFVLLLLCISNTFASSPPVSEIGDWVLENSNYTMNGTTITLHGDIYLKTTSTITIEAGGNLEIGRFWTKRIPITISTCASPDISDNYQIWVPTTVFTTDQWSDIKGGTGQADLDDVRFVSSMNATGYWESCPYWIEPDTTNPRGFWVKISSINQANSNVYMYYGNANAINVSTITDTFNNPDNFFENWDDGDYAGWSFYNSDGIRQTSTDIGQAGSTFSRYIRFYRTFGNWGGGGSLEHLFSASDYEPAILRFYNKFYYTTGCDYATHYVKVTINDAGTAKYLTYWLGTYDVTIPSDDATNKHIDARETPYNNWYYFERNVVSDLDGFASGNITAIWIGTGNRRITGTAEMKGWTDEIELYVRKYADGEPTTSAGTTEDTPTTGYHIYVYPQGQIYQKQGSGINK